MLIIKLYSVSITRNNEIFYIHHPAVALGPINRANRSVPIAAEVAPAACYVSRLHCCVRVALGVSEWRVSMPVETICLVLVQHTLFFLSVYETQARGEGAREDGLPMSHYFVLYYIVQLEVLGLLSAEKYTYRRSSHNQPLDSLVASLEGLHRPGLQ